MLDLLERFATWLHLKTCRHDWDFVPLPDGRFPRHPSQDGYQLRLHCRRCGAHYVHGQAVQGGRVFVAHGKRGLPEIVEEAG